MLARIITYKAVNQAFKIFDKNGNTLSGPTTFNSFFAPLGTGTPCGLSEHKTDPFVFYDQIADRWVITDQAQNMTKPRSTNVSVSPKLGIR